MIMTHPCPISAPFHRLILARIQKKVKVYIIMIHRETATVFLVPCLSIKHILILDSLEIQIRFLHTVH